MKELYKKYRPKKLKNMIGNEGTVQTLSNMMERDTLPHTILLTGPSGCGKTTLARIIKNELGCSEVDFKEMNCSDIRGVDSVREIARTMNMAPTGGKVRIWLLDEVHQWTKDAQNASLKILEDTPDHVYFILCTTDPQKLLKTVKTRCSELQVELLGSSDMAKLIKRVLKKEGEKMPEDLIEDLIDCAGGSARQALVILDRVLNLPEKLREEAIKEEPAEAEVIELARAVCSKAGWKKVASILKSLKSDPESIRYCVLGYARAMLLNGKDVEHQAHVIEQFADHFYDSKSAGVALACWASVSE